MKREIEKMSQTIKCFSKFPARHGSLTRSRYYVEIKQNHQIIQVSPVYSFEQAYQFYESQNQRINNWFEKLKQEYPSVKTTLFLNESCYFGEGHCSVWNFDFNEANPISFKLSIYPTMELEDHLFYQEKRWHYLNQ